MLSRLIFGFLFPLVVGIIPALLLLHNNHNIEDAISEKLITILEKEWDADIKLEQVKIDIIKGSLIVYKGVITPHATKNCSWEFDTCHINIPFYHYFFKNEIKLHITFNHVEATTPLEELQTIPLINHIKTIFSSSGNIPNISLASLTATTTTLNVATKTKSYSLHLPGMISFAQEAKRTALTRSAWAGSIMVEKGEVFIDGSPLLTLLQSKTLFENIGTDSWKITTNNTLSITSARYNNEELRLKGTWASTRKKGSLYNTSQSTSLKARSCKEGVSIKGCFDPTLLKLIGSALPIKLNIEKSDFESLVSQKGSLDILISNITCDKAQGTINLNDWGKGFLKNLDLSLSFTKDTQTLTTDSTITQEHKALHHITSSINLDTYQGNIQGTSLAPFKLSTYPYAIEEKNAHWNLTLNLAGPLEGSYGLKITNTSTMKKTAYKGKIYLHKGILSCQGNAPKGFYFISYDLLSKTIKQCSYFQGKKKRVHLTTEQNETTLHGFLDFSLLLSLLPPPYTKSLVGKRGKVILQVDQTTLPLIKGSLQAQECTLSLLESYNMLKSGSCRFMVNFLNKKATVEDIHLALYKGHATCRKAVLHLDDAYNIAFAHAPITLHNALINWKDKLYGIVYGTLLLSKPLNHHSKVSGTLILHKTLLKENIFTADSSSESIDPLFLATTAKAHKNELDLTIKTEHPLHVKTSFITTESSINLNLNALDWSNQFFQPTLKGSIIIEKGSLHFTHHNLWITTGEIHFMPHQIYNTTIDLVARNTIKKYLITLTATGSLQKPSIVLESSPSLNEEQILALLFSGSENASFQADLPAILMQNLHKIIVGNTITVPEATTFFQRIIKPFKYIQITPNFTDQSGRGGVRGNLSIDLNQHLHAQIQKNFNLQEDFSFQIEYYLNDSVNMKAIRDQRGDLGAEVEMRVKI